MLNKIKVVGKLLPYSSPDKFIQEEKKKSPIFFSVLVANPSKSITVLRLVAQNELAERIEKGEFKENEELEFSGYLRNEESSRQILITAVDIKKINAVDKSSNNQVRLLGKVITDYNQNEEGNDFVSFKIVVPREGSFSIFFCRIQGELMKEFKENVSKGDVIFLEGFLQTKKITDELEEGKISRISSIICNSFTLIDKDSSLNFPPLEFKKFTAKVKEIDFSKPKEE